jgi:MinD superfamily P-loop ATPase
MDELGISNLEEVRGLTIRRIEQRRAAGKIAVIEPIVPKVRSEKCTRCGACERVCAYEAIAVANERPAVINEQACIGCGLCVSVCRFDALEQVYY